jgi:hypothetical protein
MYNETMLLQQQQIDFAMEQFSAILEMRMFCCAEFAATSALNSARSNSLRAVRIIHSDTKH